MFRCGDDNHHVHDVHDGCEEEMAPSSNFNDTDEDESEEYIVHEPFDEPSSDNLSMDVSESEFNIVNKTLLQNNSSYVLTNVITELKYDEHIEPSVSDKGSSYFNIFECGRNVLDKLDVTYQRAFIASEATSTVPKVFYRISSARERYYDMCADHIKERNVGMDKDELLKAISHVNSEDKE